MLGVEAAVGETGGKQQHAARVVFEARSLHHRERVSQRRVQRNRRHRHGVLYELRRELSGADAFRGGLEPSPGDERDAILRRQARIDDGQDLAL